MKKRRIDRRIVVCELCDRRVMRDSLTRHQAGLECRVAYGIKRMEKDGWERCGELSMPIKRSGFEVVYVPGRVSPKLKSGEVDKIVENVPMAQYRIVEAARAVTEAMCVGGWTPVTWKKYAMIRTVFFEPEKGTSLLAVARLGGPFPIEWIPLGILRDLSPKLIRRRGFPPPPEQGELSFRHAGHTPDHAEALLDRPRDDGPVAPQEQDPRGGVGDD